MAFWENWENLNIQYRVGDTKELCQFSWYDNGTMFMQNCPYCQEMYAVYSYFK